MFDGLGDALAYLGSSIDKPGRAVRGLLGGKPREALAAIPFSDTMGITDPHDRVSGRNLTDAIGLTRSGDNGWGSWALGTGAEMATDPLAMIPAHSVFKALHGAGHFDDVAPALKGFMEGESGAARIPRPKPDTYGLAPVEQAQSARQAFKQPKGMGMEQTPGRPRYPMKSGPAPATKPLQAMPHEMERPAATVAATPINEGGDYVTMSAAPPVGSTPQYADADEMLRAYYEKQSQIQPAAAAPPIEPYAPPPSEGAMRFADDFHQSAKQASALDAMGSISGTMRSPALSRLLQQFFKPKPGMVG